MHNLPAASEWGGGWQSPVSAGTDRSLRAGVLHHAGCTPGRTALRLPDRDISYAELVSTARRWAGRLIDLAAGRPARVGVLAYRSETAYAGVLASLLAGAAFVPLNRRFPPERTLDMINQADLDVVIVDAESLPGLLPLADPLERPPPLLVPAVATGELRERWPSRVAGREDVAAALPLSELPELAPDDLAYLLFTSGSTGRPKGVPITHRNIRSFLDINLPRYALTHCDRLSQTFDQTFDLAMFDLFMAWESGASVCVLQPIELLAPARAIARFGISVWFSVPSVANRLIERNALTPGSLPGLRWSLFCGEALPQATAEAWQAAAPASVLENLYGPTELTVACAAYRWDGLRSPAHCVNGLVPIGKVYPGLAYHILDEGRRDVAPGMVGELAVAGEQTSPGYWRAPELTAERFIELADPTGRSQRYYLTGDLVRLQADNLVFIGRNDSQIKIGGYRVELGEVEATLRLAGCTQAAALAWPDSTSPVGIVAAVAGPVGVSELMDSLARRLPAHMLPRSIHALDAFPLNANGKTDRRTLRDWLALRIGPDGQPGRGDGILEATGT